MKTAKDLELSLLIKEANIQQLKFKVQELEYENERLNNIIKEVKKLLKEDYFEDGSFENEDKVYELLDLGDDKE